MDQQAQPELTFEESIKQVMQTLPPVIRNYLGQGKYSVVAENLMAKYGLHIDQGGILEREIMLLLMGIENPDEFTQSLVEEAKLDQKTIDSIVQDVNDQIFIPLREEERKSGGMKAEQPAKPVIQQPQAGSAAPRPAVTPTPGGGKPQTYFHLENKLPSARPLNVPQPRPAMLAAPQSMTNEKLLEDHEEPSPLLRTAASTARPIDNEKLLEDHEEPHLNIGVTGVILPGARFSPRLAVAPSEGGPLAPKVESPAKPVAIVPPRPAVVPNVGGPTPIVQTKPISSPIVPTVPAVPITPTPPKAYSSDPYREPIDEITT